MANKALATRQKLMIRVEPSQKALKARNPVAPDARQRYTESQHKSTLKGKSLQQKLLKKIDSGEGGD
ncbi:MAG TPA: hypothetical protein VJ652_03660 [Noviherbaspirillum sp.]|nr:hypothetical protein [Noviherbaspirillum sp.]